MIIVFFLKNKTLIICWEQFLKYKIYFLSSEYVTLDPENLLWLFFQLLIPKNLIWKQISWCNFLCTKSPSKPSNRQLHTALRTKVAVRYGQQKSVVSSGSSINRSTMSRKTCNDIQSKLRQSKVHAFTWTVYNKLQILLEILVFKHRMEKSHEE